MASDLEQAYNALIAKQDRYNQLWAYYDGNQPLKYTNSRLREIFKHIDAHFEQNWCAVVVDSTLDRINLARMTVVDNDAATEQLAKEWERLELSLEDDSIHLATLVCGEAFLIIWPDEQNQTEAYYNDPRLCHVQYDPAHPRRKLWAAKWWVDADDKRRITMYYPDRLEYYVSRQKYDQVQDARAFIADPVLPSAKNDKGIVPVFHFTRERRAITSELGNVLTQQDAINKLLTDMLVAAEFGAFRQRYIISAEDPDTLLGSLRNAPNEIWSIPSATNEDQPTQVGEFGQTDLGGYLDAMDKLASAVAIITRTPKHYLYQQTGAPSGEALIAMEAPQVKKCKQYIERWAADWRDPAAFVLALAGTTVDPFAIEPVFDSPDTILPATQADVRVKSVQAGIPLATVLRKMEGWTEGELAEMEADKQAEGQAQQALMADAMVQAAQSMRQPPEQYVEEGQPAQFGGEDGQG